MYTDQNMPPASGDALLEQTHDAPVDYAAASAQPRMSYADVPGDSLADFLTRPRQIKSYSWAVNTPLQEHFAPWEEFFLLSRVREKVRGYSRFRGNLKIDILVNGSSFHTGTVYASYLPLGNDYSNDGFFNAGVITDAGARGVGHPNGATYHSFRPADSLAVSACRFVPYSQRQHIRLYPSENIGGSLVLPFIFPEEYLTIDEVFKDALYTECPTQAMGTVTLASLGDLYFLGDNAPDDVDIVVLASLEPGYELVAPTVFELQSAEPRGGSRIRASPARVGTGGFADVVAAVGPTVARLMGFSNPPLQTDVDTVRVNSVNNVANGQLSNRDEVLALDPQTTLACTSDVLGGDESEMLISNLVAKDSFLTAFDWPATGSSSAPNSVLSQARVTPSLCLTEIRMGDSSRTYLQVFPTPSSWIAEAFELWRGDLIFSFEVITTKFQKGRLKVTFDPNGVNSGAVDTLGRVMTKIIDISENTRSEFRVPYLAATAWLRTGQPRGDLDGAYSLDSPLVTPQGYLQPSPQALAPRGSDHYNGLLSVQVLTTLTNNVNARVIVSVRGADNLEFAVPRAISDAISLQDPFFIQSADLSDVYVGEKIVSIRDICHRSCPITGMRGNSNSWFLAALKFPVTGVPRGVGLNSGTAQIRSGGTTALYGAGSDDRHTFYQWFASGFAMARSSHRVQLSNVGAARGGGLPPATIAVDRGVHACVEVTSNEPGMDSRPFSCLAERLAYRVVQNGPIDAGVASWYDHFLSAGNGASVVDNGLGGVLVPYQSHRKFSPTNQYFDYYRRVLFKTTGTLIGEPILSGWPSGASSVQTAKMASRFTPVDTIKVTTSTLGAAALPAAYTSAGSDLCLAHFTNAPTYFRVKNRAWNNGPALAEDTLVKDVLCDYSYLRAVNTL
nr:MAG: polyprotein [Picornavirales sp.]